MAPEECSKPHVVILGGGPAGLGAAFQLASRRLARVTLLEQSERVGGNAGSFLLDGLYVDYGSHRLHPACHPAILEDLRRLLGDDLLLRPRHGRIRLRGRWISFPLRPLELALKLPLDFSSGVALDALRGMINRPALRNGSESFASILEQSLGRTICRDFYFPYARKLWGLDPEELSAVQARRRVSAGSLAKMAKKVLGGIPGLKPAGQGCFFYPRRGYGQISEALCRAAVERGAEVLLQARVGAVHLAGKRVAAVAYQRDGREHLVEADFVWSTIPVSLLVQIIRPPADRELLAAARQIRSRAMILIYIVLAQDRFSPYDAHYFPGAEVPITRLSEPKNYSGASEPAGRTVLCAELPSSADSREWGMSDEELGRLALDSMAACEIPVKAPVLRVVTRRIQHAYPIYSRGYESYFEKLDRWIEGIEGLLTFGRQGLFAHDNIHHALYMAYSAVDCLDAKGRFDLEKWRSRRRVFQSHVVED